jgi:hypothetical protein
MPKLSKSRSEIRMKCPSCDEEFRPTLEEITQEIEAIYPQDIFKSHPVAWVRRLLKFLCGMDYHVLIDEATYTKWKGDKKE